MKILEQILQEIDKKADYYESNEQGREHIRMVDMVEVEDIIRSHTEDDGWIPVEQRLLTREEYLKDDGRFMLDDGNRRYQGLFNIYDGKFVFSKHISGINYELFEDKCVIAWQPLPAPYKSD